MNFLPGLVAPRVGVFVTELGQQTLCVLYFLVVYFSCFYLCLLRDVETLTRTLQMSKLVTEHIKTSVLEFHLASEQAPCLF